MSDDALWLYLIDLSLVGRYPFLSLLLNYLLPLLYIFFRGRSERVVELIIAFIHHVPISVSLLQHRETKRDVNKWTPKAAAVSMRHTREITGPLTFWSSSHWSFSSTLSNTNPPVPSSFLPEVEPD